MAEVAAPAGTPRLDVCRLCQLIWFDPGEAAACPPPPPPAPTPALPREAREALAMLKVELIAERAREEGAGEDGPAQWWKVIPAAAGLPVEYEAASLARRPLATWATAAVIAAASMLALHDPRPTVAAFGLLPADPWRYGGLTFLTSLLVHAGAIHLLGNLYFLLAFGDDVEDLLGRRDWLLLFLLAGLAGGALHLGLDPRAGVPLVGASASISGLLAFYALAFPRVRLAFLLWSSWAHRWVRAPAYAVALGWAILQLLGARHQLAGLGQVSAAAHLGGATVGLAFWAERRHRGAI
jgi:membrane associated rhomboid family serine protease